MILTCPRDETVLDLGEWSLLSINVKTNESVYVWSRCAGPGAPHWVSVTWHGMKPTVRTGAIVAVTPAVSHMPTRGLSPAPPLVRPVKSSGSMPMVIRKR